MKRLFLMSAFAMQFIAAATTAQQLPQLQVPSLVLNSFQQSFPKPYDVEWEMDGELYKVEFETGWFGPDHDAWFDKTGKLIRLKEEISKDNLPPVILGKISSDFSGYKVDDVKKITEGEKVVFVIDLETSAQEWKVAFDLEGNLISKVDG